MPIDFNKIFGQEEKEPSPLIQEPIPQPEQGIEATVDWERIFGREKSIIPEEGIIKPEKKPSGFLEKLKQVGASLAARAKERQAIEAPEELKVMMARRAIPPKPIVGPPVPKGGFPTMRAMTPKEKAISESGIAPGGISEAMLRPKPEDLEGMDKFSKLMDIPTQGMFHFLNSLGWGLPEKIAGPIPDPKTEAAQITGGLASLTGMIGPGGIAFAPFKVTGKMMTRVLGKQATTLPGKVIQNIVKNIGTLSVAMGASEWSGENPVEILKNKVKAGGEGALTGLIFGGTQFLSFAKEYPALSWLLRTGVSSAALDIASGARPWDERSLFKKSFDYGLNAFFMREGVSPKDYQWLDKNVTKELRKARHEAAADGLEGSLPPEQDMRASLDAWLEKAAASSERKPEEVKTWAEMPRVKKAETTPELRQFYTETGKVEAEARRPLSVNVKQEPDGSLTITQAGQPAAAPPTPKAAEYPKEFNEKGEATGWIHENNLDVPEGSGRHYFTS